MQKNKIYIDKWTTGQQATKIRIIKITEIHTTDISYKLIWSNYQGLDSLLLIGSEAYNNLKELTNEEKIEYL